MRGRNFYTELKKKDLTYSILTILLETQKGKNLGKKMIQKCILCKD